MEAVKQPEAARGGGRRRGTGGAQRMFRAAVILCMILQCWMSLHVCPNPQNVQHQERALVSTGGAGWCRWVEANLLMATNHHSDRGVDSWGDFVGAGQRVYGKPLHLLLSFAVNLKLL